MTDTKPFVIALDGPAASGKSSVGLGAAQRLGLGYFDTGLLYRALTWLALEEGVDVGNAQHIVALIDRLEITLNPHGRLLRHGADITDALQQPAVDASVSVVAAYPAVRHAMRPAQRALIRPPGLIMAGRDIGTVIVPEAQLKVWLSASIEERARRRAAQTGEPVERVLDGMRRRDELDATREVAPMTAAADAITLETDGLSPEAVVEQMVVLATQRGARSMRG